MSDPPILICYDGSEESLHAIAAAASLLGPRAAVVLDLAPALTPSESVAFATSALPGAEFEQLSETLAEDGANEGVARARAAGFDAAPRAGLAAPTWAGIVDIADELDSPVIVMGTRSLRAGHELLEGSVSHQVIRHSHRPVLVVPLPR
jgi:nucleotide-binding universal stress UspA family protein